MANGNKVGYTIIHPVDDFVHATLRIIPRHLKLMNEPLPLFNCGLVFLDRRDVL